jgi:uncharacterized protein (TIGR02001 family)
MLMKKVLVALSISLLASSSFATTQCTTTACKKQQQKKMQHRKHIETHQHKIQTSASSHSNINHANYSNSNHARPADPVAPTSSGTGQGDVNLAADQDPLSGLSGTMALTNNYVFRGISQTQNLPAVQGGLTYLLPIGLYINGWASNVNFQDALGNQATIEIDAIGGFRRSFFDDDFSFDVNLARYYYPRARAINYNEINSLVVYKILQLGLSYSGNAYNTHQSGTYYNATVTFPIPPRMALHLQDLTFSVELGRYHLPRAAGGSYTDFALSFNKEINKTYTFLLQWVGTNGEQHNSPYDSKQFVGMVTASF